MVFGRAWKKLSNEEAFKKIEKIMVDGFVVAGGGSALYTSSANYKENWTVCMEIGILVYLSFDVLFVYLTNIQTCCIVYCKSIFPIVGKFMVTDFQIAGELQPFQILHTTYRKMDHIQGNWYCFVCYDSIMVFVFDVVLVIYTGIFQEIL